MLRIGELVGANQHLLGSVRGEKLLQVAAFKQARRECEFLVQLLPPLLAQRGGGDDEDASFAFSPVLADHDPGLDGFTQADLVGQDHARGEGGVQSEQCRVHLVGFRFDLGVKE